MFDAYHSGLLWEWDGSSWRSRQTSGGPLRRARPLGAFDPARGVLIVFGGDRGVRTDTWEWDGTRWTQVATRGPNLDIGSSMTFDERRGVCVAVGAASFDGPGQAWEYDPRTRQWGLTSEAALPWTWWPALCYDPLRGHVFLHAGSDFTATSSTRTWLYTPMDLVPARQETDPGRRLSFGLIRPNDAGSLFLTGLSLGGDGIPILTSAHGQVLWPLANDLLFRLSLQVPTLRGALDAQGRGRAYLDLPNDPALSGLYLAASALLLDPQGIRSVTRDVRALVR